MTSRILIRNSACGDIAAEVKRLPRLRNKTNRNFIKTGKIRLDSVFLFCQSFLSFLSSLIRYDCYTFLTAK